MFMPTVGSGTPAFASTSNYRTSDANPTHARCGQTPPLNSFQQVSDPIDDDYSEEDAAAISSLESLLALRPKAQPQPAEPMSCDSRRSHLEAQSNYDSLPRNEIDRCSEHLTQQEETEYMVRVVVNGKKSKEDILRVQILIERCLSLWMTQCETLSVLQAEAKIEPGFTLLVWNQLEAENHEFFKKYYQELSLIRKEQEVFGQHILERRQAQAVSSVLSHHSDRYSSNPWSHVSPESS